MKGFLLYMNIVLSTLNSKYIHSSLALRYLARYGETKNQAYDIVEYTINMPILDIISNLSTYEADVIGFACYIWNIDMTFHVASLVKAIRPETIIVLGGPEVSYNASDILEAHPEVDYIVQGEGEEAWTAFVGALQNGDDPLLIPGIKGRRHGQVAGSDEIVEVKDLGTIPFPYTEEDMKDLTNKIIYYESSRGCPFSCQYCLSGNRNTVRFFPQERTLKELQWFVDHGVKQVKFVDRTFNCAKHHHIPLMKWMNEHGKNTNFHLEMESILMDEEEVKLLSESPKGRFQIEVGVQSTHEKTLAAIHRRNDWQHIVEVMTPIIAAKRTHVHMDLIVGLPYEDKERFAISFNDLFSLHPEALQIGFLKLLQGSGVRKMAEYQYVHDPKAPYEVLATHVMPYEDIRFLKHFEDVFERFYNSERYELLFTYISRRLTESGASAFHYFEEMTRAWLDARNHERKLNDQDQLAFLYAFLKGKGDTIGMDLLRLATLYAFKGKIKGDALGLGRDRKEEWQQSEYFWRHEELVRQYIPNYVFHEWRRIRQDYYELPIHKETIDYLGILADLHTISQADQAYIAIVDTTGVVPIFLRPKPIAQGLITDSMHKEV